MPYSEALSDCVSFLVFFSCTVLKIEPDDFIAPVNKEKLHLGITLFIRPFFFHFLLAPHMFLRTLLVVKNIKVCL